MLDIRYQPGDPPWLLGRGPLNGQRARAGGLSWYQPWGRCHHIAPFKWAIAQAVFPDFKWGFVSSDKHTVVVGYRDDWMQPEWVMDIILFRTLTAEESLALAMGKGWQFYPSLHPYLASFCAAPEAALEVLRQFEI